MAQCWLFVVAVVLFSALSGFPLAHASPLVCSSARFGWMDERESFGGALISGTVKNADVVESTGPKGQGMDMFLLAGGKHRQYKPGYLDAYDLNSILVFCPQMLNVSQTNTLLSFQRPDVRGWHGMLGVTVLSENGHEQYALFAGGKVQDSMGEYAFTNYVQVYHATSGNWSVTQMPITAEENFQMVAAPGKAYLTNGHSAVHVYHVETDLWTKLPIQDVRTFAALAVCFDRVFIAGGSIQGELTDEIIVFDAENETQLESLRLSAPREKMIATHLGEKVIFAGGNSNTVQIYDLFSEKWNLVETDHAYGPIGISSDWSVTTLDEQIYFISKTNGTVDILNIVSETWHHHVTPTLHKGGVFLPNPADGAVYIIGGVEEETASSIRYNTQIDRLLCLPGNSILAYNELGVNKKVVVQVIVDLAMPSAQIHVSHRLPLHLCIKRAVAPDLDNFDELTCTYYRNLNAHSSVEAQLSSFSIDLSNEVYFLALFLNINETSEAVPRDIVAVSMEGTQCPNHAVCPCQDPRHLDSMASVGSNETALFAFVVPNNVGSFQLSSTCYSGHLSLARARSPLVASEYNATGDQTIWVPLPLPGTWYLWVDNQSNASEPCDVLLEKDVCNTSFCGPMCTEELLPAPEGVKIDHRSILPEVWLYYRWKGFSLVVGAHALENETLVSDIEMYASLGQIPSKESHDFKARRITNSDASYILATSILPVEWYVGITSASLQNVSVWFNKCADPWNGWHCDRPVPAPEPEPQSAPEPEIEPAPESNSTAPEPNSIAPEPIAKSCPIANGQECSGNGFCDNTTWVCLCSTNWVGRACDVPCPRMDADSPPCNGTGLCKLRDDGTSSYCDCVASGGKFCQLICTSESCGEHGACGYTDDSITCSCNRGWGGEKCSEPIIPPNGLPIILAVVGALVVAVGVVLILLWKKHKDDQTRGYQPLSFSSAI